MYYEIKVNKVENSESNLKGFASVVFGDSFKVTNIAILESKKYDRLFVSMPSYPTNEVDENQRPIYKEFCHPIDPGFRMKLHADIIAEYERVAGIRDNDRPITIKTDAPLEVKVVATPYEKKESNLRGFASIYIGGVFKVNNVSILQGKENLFVSMPSYKTNQMDEQNRPVYRDVCYPVTKEFRDNLYKEILLTYREAKTKKQETPFDEKPVEKAQREPAKKKKGK